MFNNSLPKTKRTLVNILRDEVDVTKYSPMLAEAEANNCLNIKVKTLTTK